MAEQLPPSVLIYFCSVSTFDTYVIMLYFFWFCRLFPGCLQVIVTAVIWIPCHYGQFSINTDTFCGWQIINGCDCTYLEWNTYSFIAYSLCRVSWKTKSGKEKIKSWKEELIQLRGWCPLLKWSSSCGRSPRQCNSLFFDSIFNALTKQKRVTLGLFQGIDAWPL